MSPVRKYLVMLFIILASFGSCFGRVYHGDPLVANLDEAYGPADPRAYVTPISYIHQQDYEYQPGFVEYWMKSVAKRFWSTVMRSSQENTRSTSTSPWLVNVDDFGAKGYGKDDSTEVRASTIFFLLFLLLCFFFGCIAQSAWIFSLTDMGWICTPSYDNDRLFVKLGRRLVILQIVFS